MNEDLHPCYDIASDWEIVPFDTPGKQICRHKDCKSLYRIIDFKEQTIKFNDTERVRPAAVIDIYKNVPLKEKAEMMGLILNVMLEEKPISLPYIHEDLKVYIEKHDNCVGLLYYKDSDAEESIVPIKRFFAIGRIPKLSFTEITWSEFYALSGKEAEENDKTAKGDA